MITIVLDYSDWKTFFINHTEDDDVENLLFEKFDFSEGWIEWMTVDKLHFETLQ